MTHDVSIRWKALVDGVPEWKSTRCLYAYVAQNNGEILYIGKAWGVSVRARWTRTAKASFWDDLEEQRGIYKHGVLFGELTTMTRLSSQLLADIESLLIAAEQPWGNIQCRRSRIERPGLVVKCIGAWPGRATMYMDGFHRAV